MAARVVQWIFAAFLLAVGAYLGVRGAELISLGGSWYYALTGAGIAAVAVLVVAAVVAATVTVVMVFVGFLGF